MPGVLATLGHVADLFGAGRIPLTMKMASPIMFITFIMLAAETEAKLQLEIVDSLLLLKVGIQKISLLQ